MTNPFAPQVPTEQQAPQQAAPGNPFAQQQAAQAMPAPGNPFAQQQAAPPVPAAPQAYAAPAQQTAPAPGFANPYQHPASGRPAGMDHMTHVQQSYAQPQQTAPAPQAYAAPAQQQVPQFGPVQSAPAPVVSEGRGPNLADMYGRLVMIFPHSLETVQRRPEHITAEQRAAGNTTQPRMTATVVVLDAGPGKMDPIAFGGKPYAIPPTPHTDSAPLPYVRKGMWINQSRLISQLRDSLPAGPGQPCGIVIGRVTKAGPQQNDPWYLLGAGPDEMALANKYLEGVQVGHFPNPLAA